MQRHADTANQIATLLTASRQTIAVAESSSGGLVSATLLAVPGASAYYLGGAVVYTKTARDQLIGVTDADMQHCRSSTEAYANVLASRIREQHNSTWGLAETGAAGPSGNRYGDKAGHCCIAIAGPVEIALTIETGSGDRLANMHRFTQALLDTFLRVLSADKTG